MGYFSSARVFFFFFLWQQVAAQRKCAALYFRALHLLCPGRGDDICRIFVSDGSCHAPTPPLLWHPISNIKRRDGKPQRGSVDHSAAAVKNQDTHRDATHKPSWAYSFSAPQKSLITLYNKIFLFRAATNAPRPCRGLSGVHIMCTDDGWMDGWAATNDYFHYWLNCWLFPRLIVGSVKWQ